MTATDPTPPPSGAPQTGGAGRELVLASLIVLFQELALIRWLPGQVRVAAYFPNLILIAAFLGLGIGALRARHASLFRLWLPLLLVLVACAWWMSGVAFTANSVSEHLWLLYHDLPPGATVIEGVRIPIVVLFVLTAASFVSLGQLVARRLEAFRAQARPLRGYIFDLLGSLLGVVAFAFLSFSGAFPVAWFGLILLAAALLVRTVDPRGWLVHAVAGVLILVSVSSAEKARFYSPYYALDVTSELIVRTNGSIHQWARPLRWDDRVAPDHDVTRRGYHLPYQLHGKPLGKVLVLGAGTGNDIAVLLDEGAEEVHAVEIDPVILRLGRELHPNAPYDSPRVKVFNTDARSFLNESEELYDLVVFGTLDSMTRLSALSNVRLDNFVYTRDALAAARARVKPDGGMALFFEVNNPSIEAHIGAMLHDAWGAAPTVLVGEWVLFNHVFLAGPAFADLPENAGESAGGAILPAATAVVDPSAIPTDDWPYLYLPERGVNAFYLSLLAIFSVLSVITIFVASPEMRASVRRGGGADIEMFLFGFAFLLLETRFVTSMNLLWGATWLTSAVVFGAILATILVSTLLTQWKALPWRAAAAGLLLSLVVVTVVPASAALAQNVPLRLGFSVLYVGTPISFAAVCFALRFRERREVDRAFGWNLLGAVAGGMAEFLSMSIGLRALLFLAIAAYLGAFATKAWTGRAAQRVTAA